MESVKFAEQYPTIGRPIYVAPTGQKHSDLQLAIQFERQLTQTEIDAVTAFLQDISGHFGETRTYASDTRVLVVRYKGPALENKLLALLQRYFQPIKPYSANVILHVKPNPLIAFITFAGKAPNADARNSMLAQLREQPLISVVYYHAKTNVISVLFQVRTAKLALAAVKSALTAQDEAGLRFKLDKTEDLETLMHRITTSL